MVLEAPALESVESGNTGHSQSEPVITGCGSSTSAVCVCVCMSCDTQVLVIW